MRDGITLAPLWMYYSVFFGYNKVGDILKSKIDDSLWEVTKDDFLNTSRSIELRRAKCQHHLAL